MAKPSKTKSAKISVPETTEINLALNLKASVSRGEVSRISFTLNLNPDGHVLKLNEYLSTYPDLLAVFDDLKRVLTDINKRTEIYNAITQIDFAAAKRFGLQPGYEQNIKPPFGKITSIDYRHESPGEANVSYSRRTNGDLEPPPR